MSGIDDRSFIAVIIKAMQELITEVDNLAITVAGFAQKFLSHEVDTDQLCVTDTNGKTCVTRTQLDALLSGNNAPLPQTASPSLIPDATTTNTTSTDPASTTEASPTPSVPADAATVATSTAQ